MNILYILYYILIITCIFQDFFLGSKIGALGMAVTPLIAPVIFIFYIVIKGKVSVNSKSIKKLINLQIYLFVINIIFSIWYFFIHNGDIYVLSENMFFKMIKANSYFILIIIYLILLENIQKCLNIRKVLKPFVAIYYLLFIILLTEEISPNSINYLFHSGTEYNRIRLTTSEASTTGTLIVLSFVITSFYYIYENRNRFKLALVIVTFGIFIVTSGSKGFLVCMFLAMGIMVLGQDIKWYKKLVLIFIIMIMIGYKYTFILNSFQNDIEQFTSVTTRVYTSYCSLIYSIKYPLGTGTSMYLNLYPKILYDNLHILDNLNLRLNFSEVYSYINGINDKNMSAKIPVLQYGMYWGIFGTIYFITYWIGIYRNIRSSSFQGKRLILFGYLFTLIAIFTYVDFDIKYEIWSYIALIDYLILQKCNTDCTQVKKDIYYQ